MKKNMLISLLIFISVISACGQNQHAQREFTLPKGSAENGKLLFKEYQCIQCHTIPGTEYASGEWRPAENVGISVQLGGDKSQIKTYGDLVTAIINPSHRIAKGYSKEQVVDKGETPGEDESKMPVYNAIMTIDDLVDIVSFLEKQYTLQDYNETNYRYFDYPF